MMPLWQLAAIGLGLGVLLALLVLRRRQTAADADAPVPHVYELDPDEWQDVSRAARRRLLLRGGRRLRGRPSAVFRRHRDGALRVALDKAHSYDGRPQWPDIYELTLHMGRLVRAWPGARVGGIIRYADAVVPVPWSAELFADLEVLAAEYRAAMKSGTPPDPRPLHGRAMAAEGGAADDGAPDPAAGSPRAQPKRQTSIASTP